MEFSNSGEAYDRAIIALRENPDDPAAFRRYEREQQRYLMDLMRDVSRTQQEAASE